jgi:hypothetical protein
MRFNVLLFMNYYDLYTCIITLFELLKNTVFAYLVILFFKEQ